MAGVQFSLQGLAVTGHAETEGPKYQGGKDITLNGITQPVWVGEGGLDHRQQIEQTDNKHQSGVLKQGDKGIDYSRDHQLERLGQDNQTHRLPVTQSEGIGRLVLTLRDGLQAAANHLCHIG